MRISDELAVITRTSAVLAMLLLMAVRMSAADYDQPPISYSQGMPKDPIAQLMVRLQTGQTILAFDQHRGYLPAILQALAVPPSSQTLVLSKTSLQKDVISPTTPRALYFNDEVYVGTCVDGTHLELSAIDPQLGPVFYVLEQHEQTHPLLVRKTDECLECHDLRSFTGGVPGLMMRSVYPDEDGQPLLALGSSITDQETDWSERWGGWYVTGTYGRMRHLGNLTFDATTTLNTINREPGANHLALDKRIPLQEYLRGTSDVVALMLLAHQTQMHNRITKANYEARQAMSYQEAMKKALADPNFISDSAVRRIHSAGDALLHYMLFCDEPHLLDPVIGGEEFSHDFMANRPHDARGRSLYQLDLTRRLLRYPCSYLIYSPSFRELPAPLLTYVYARLHEILTAKETGDEFRNLTAGERTDIREILVATIPDLQAAWK